MHSVNCPGCRTCVEFDFLPVAGLVWCPKCQELFSPPFETGVEPPKAEQIDTTDHRDGKAG